MISNKNNLPLATLDGIREIITKHSMPDAAASLISRVREFAGLGESIVILRGLEKIAALAADNLVEAVIAKNDTGLQLGAKVEIVRTAAKYDYSVCGDPVLANLEKQADALKQEIKIRQQFLRSIGGETRTADGEITKTNETLIEYVNDKGENATAVVNRAALLEQGQTIKITFPK